MGNRTDFSITLWEGAAFLIAVQAYNQQDYSGYSNIEQFTIRAQGDSVLLSDYFPLEVGNEWVYHTSNSSKWTRVVESISYPLTCYTGRYSPTAYPMNVVQLYSAGKFEYFDLNGGFGYWGSDEDGEGYRIDNGFVFDDIMNVGQSVELIRDIYDDGGKFSREGNLKLEFLEKIGITVPAGNFSDCIHLRFTSSNVDPGETNVWEEWWAKGVGRIRISNSKNSAELENYTLY